MEFELRLSIRVPTRSTKMRALTNSKGFVVVVVLVQLKGGTYLGYCDIEFSQILSYNAILLCYTSLVNNLRALSVFIQPNSFSTQPNSFSLQPNSFSLQPNSFSLQQISFSTQHISFSLQHISFSLQHISFSLQPNSFSTTTK